MFNKKFKQKYFVYNIMFTFHRGYSIHFKLMPTVIFVNAVVSILYHFGVMQAVIEKLAVVMYYTMGTSSAETMCTASSIFLGQVISMNGSSLEKLLNYKKKNLTTFCLNVASFYQHFITPLARSFFHHTSISGEDDTF